MYLGTLEYSKDLELQGLDPLLRLGPLQGFPKVGPVVKVRPWHVGISAEIFGPVARVGYVPKELDKAP